KKINPKKINTKKINTKKINTKKINTKKINTKKINTKKIDGMKKNALERKEDGLGKIYYEKTKNFLDFKLSQDGLAVVLKRDEIQHPFLVELNQWADSMALYHFGSDFGKSNFMAQTDSQIFFNNPAPPLFDDPNNLVAVYSSASIKFGEDFDKDIIDNMNSLGYSLTEVGSGSLQVMTNFPIPAIGIFIVESDLKFHNPQMQMSQGMFRALAIIIHLNVAIRAKNKKLILVDDIGEGLDYERAVKIIDFLIKKTQDNDMQLIMTSNDRFVMNKVPLKYWSVIKRTGGIVKIFNPRNSHEQFNRFKYIGLNNFDFFASDFFEPSIKSAIEEEILDD
ncbi:MAG: AAA family ATPase, partial [Methylococcales bacterium]|nr:AAA family ATPase [Methylococcales bacterium]